MRKGLFVLLAMALVVALAVPASAEMKLNGFYRVKPTMSNFLGAGNLSLNRSGAASDNNASALVKTFRAGVTSGIETDSTRMFTEMRNRLRFEVGDENVKGVTFFEIDGNFGDTGGQIGRNQGFASNGDSINIETKNVYVWFKIPGTTLDFTVGLQGYTDEFAGLLFGASDQAGVVANYKFAPVALRLTWLKISDSVSDANGDNTFKWGGNNPFDADTDYYAVDVKFSPTKELTATVHGGYLRDSANKLASLIGGSYNRLHSYYAGANATFKLAPATLTGFFLYNFGQFEFAPPEPDLDIAGYAGSIRADANVGPGKVFLEGLYVSGDNQDDDKIKTVINGSDFAILTSYYARPDLVILFPNADMINSASALMLNPNNSGQGISLLAAGYSQKFTDKISAKVGAGYLRANKLSTTTIKGKAMGTEINANVNYNITKGLDFGIYGAYCFLGSYYDRADGQPDPDNLYVVNGRLNFAF